MIKFSKYENLNAAIVDSLRILKKELPNILSPYTYEIIIFGSCARGTANGSSDIDIAIVIDGDYPQTLIGRLRGIEEINYSFDFHTYTKSNFIRTDIDIYNRIRKEGIKWDCIVMDLTGWEV